MLLPNSASTRVGCSGVALGSVTKSLAEIPQDHLTLGDHEPLSPTPQPLHKGVLFQAPTRPLELPRPDKYPGSGVSGTVLSILVHAAPLPTRGSLDLVQWSVPGWAGPDNSQGPSSYTPSSNQIIIHRVLTFGSQQGPKRSTNMRLS